MVGRRNGIFIYGIWAGQIKGMDGWIGGAVEGNEGREGMDDHPN
jgi:hypothetical protein